jgi:hypothetical protein
MTRRIEHRTVFAWPASRVYEAYIDVDYLTDRLRTLGGRNELVEHAATPDGVRLRVRQVVHAESMPAVARTLVGSDLTINRSEVWRREQEGRYAGEVVAEVPGMPCSISGSQWLRDMPKHARESEFLIQGTVRVGIPLIGGKMEDLFVGEVRKLLTEEDQFTADWLTRKQ